MVCLRRFSTEAPAARRKRPYDAGRMLSTTEGRAGAGCRASVSPPAVASSHEGVYGPSQLPGSGILSAGQDGKCVGLGEE